MGLRQQLLGRHKPDGWRTAFRVPAPDQLKRRRIERVVVPERVVRQRQIGKVVRVVLRGQPLRIARQALGHRLQRIFQQAGIALEIAVVLAVHGDQAAAIRPDPFEEQWPVQREAAEIDVDAHHHHLHAGIQQHRDQGPRQAVDVVVEGDVELEAERLAQLRQRGQGAQELGRAGHGGEVIRHGAAAQPAGRRRLAEALQVAVAGRAQPVAQGLRHLAGPDGPRGGLPVLGALDLIQRVVQILAVELPDDGLVVSVADVGVGVMEEEDFTNHARGSNPLENLATNPARGRNSSFTNEHEWQKIFGDIGKIRRMRRNVFVLGPRRAEELWCWR